MNNREPLPFYCILCQNKPSLLCYYIQTAFVFAFPFLCLFGPACVPCSPGTTNKNTPSTTCGKGITATPVGSSVFKCLPSSVHCLIDQNIVKNCVQLVCTGT